MFAPRKTFVSLEIQEARLLFQNYAAWQYVQRGAPTKWAVIGKLLQVNLS